MHSDTYPSSTEIFDGIPNRDGQVDLFIDWFKGIQSFADKAIDLLVQEMGILEIEREELFPEFHEYLDDSLGLSANLILQPNTSEVDVSRVYSVDMYVIGGIAIGFFVWIIYTAVKISRWKEQHG